MPYDSLVNLTPHYPNPILLSHHFLHPSVVHLAASTSNFTNRLLRFSSAMRRRNAVDFSNYAIRFVAPFMLISVTAPLFCLVDDMATKHVFAKLYYVACGIVMGSMGVISRFAFGMVIRETEKITNKTEDTLKSLEKLRELQRLIFMAVFIIFGQSCLFAFWPFFQVRSSWNVIAACPLLIHCVVEPVVIHVFWPHRKGGKVTPDSHLNSTSPHTAEIITRGDEGDDDGFAGDGEVRSASRVPT